MRTISRFLAAAIIVLPMLAGAATVEELQAQAAELLSRIAALQQQLAVGGGTTISVPATVDSSACPLIGRSLKRGVSGDDVTRLQQFLARDSSIYPEALVTGYFGALTEAAVKRWQVKYNIVSSGDAASTGYGVVGPRTAAAIALVCSTMTGGSSGSVAPVGGFIQVSPVAGNAPLAITVQATVNTVNSCAGATYALDYGDGTIPAQIVVPIGNCQQMTQTLGHTYPYGGTYTITLSSGTHKTTATIIVSGSPAPLPTNPTPAPAQPVGSITAFVTSGMAPLTTTFYVSCVGGTAYNVVFGDGQELGSANVAQSTCGGGLQAVSHTYTLAGTYTADLFVFFQQTQGTITSKKIGSVTINVSGTTTPAPTTGTTYAIVSIAPGVGGNPLAVSMEITVPSCPTYTLNWGDATAAVATQSSCTSPQQTTQTVSHTYAAAGSYTITLIGGNQTATASIVISN